MVEVDGRAFWRPTTPPPVYWQTTEAGATVLAEDDPAARIERLFAKEPEFLPVYKRILLMADTEEGTSMGLMSVAVDTDPAIAENRRFYVQHFVESLERAGRLRLGRRRLARHRCRPRGAGRCAGRGDRRLRSASR